MAVLEIKDYSLGFKDSRGKIYNMLDQISIRVEEGKALGIVGESGCGKSMTSLSMMRLLPKSAVVQGGSIFFEGKDILTQGTREIEKMRGKDISMIFQEPMTSLNPVLTIGFQLGEALKTHFPHMKNDEIQKKCLEMLDLVGIPNPQARMNQYPHEFSGGMRQRVMIAMALICGPKLLIADEPTTALDVTIQAQILELMKKIKKRGSLVLITHNLGIVAEVCEEIAVMYAGCVVEQGSLDEIFNHPVHPYTIGLMKAVPTLSSAREELYTIPGTVPTIANYPQGCRFAGRCNKVMEICHQQKPMRKLLGDRPHAVTCWLATEEEATS